MTTRLILMGFGTVGQGLADIIVEREALLKERGFDAKVVAIVDSKGAMISEDGTGINLKEALRKKRLEGSVAEERASPIEVLEQVDCDIVVDMTPTNIDTGEPGLSIMYRAFEMKRHVVTSNKGPLAIDFSGLSNAARDAGVLLRYEATVGGGMHLLSFIRDSLSSCKVFYIEGVLNGTCNYILSRMEETEYPYEEVLEEAKGLGIAEADPTYDVSGLDAACKLTIIANVVFGRNVTYSDVMTTGITEITPEALLLAADGGYAIKMIGVAKDTSLKVAPMLVPRDSPLNVHGTLNVASIHTDVAKTITLMGRGAGASETASSVLSDIIAIHNVISH